MSITVVPSKSKPAEMTVVAVRIGFGDIFMVTLRAVLSLAVIGAVVWGFYALLILALG